MPSAAKLLLLPTVLTGALLGPAALAGAQGSSIAWTDCPTAENPTLKCGKFEVPYDYARPDGRRFTLALEKLPASGRKVATMFTNPGGPGEEGRGSWANAAKSPSIRRSFDLVGFDPRGIGKTRPAFDCSPVSGPGIEPPDRLNVDWVALSTPMARANIRANRACQKKSAAFIAHVGTNNVVRDLDAMREAVGDRKLTFWGMSYGTRIGYVYAYRYPNRVRAILLDGPVTPNGSWTDFVAVRTQSQDQALQFIRAVSPATYAAILSTRNGLFASPLALGGKDNELLDGYSWLGLTGVLLLQQSNWPQLAGLAKIVAAARVPGQDGAPARAELRRLIGLLAGGEASNALGNGGANQAINCSDYADRIPARARRRIVRNTMAKAPVYGWSVYSTVSTCEGFTFRPDPVPRIASKASLARVKKLKLAISDSTADAATPIVWGRAMARAFPSASEVTMRTGNHVNWLGTPSTCVNTRLRLYMLRQQMPPRRQTCLFSAPKGLDMEAVAAGSRKLDPGRVVDRLIRNYRRLHP